MSATGRPVRPALGQAERTGRRQRSIRDLDAAVEEEEGLVSHSTAGSSVQRHLLGLWEELGEKHQGPQHHGVLRCGGEMQLSWLGSAHAHRCGLPHAGHTCPSLSTASMSAHRPLGCAAGRPAPTSRTLECLPEHMSKDSRASHSPHCACLCSWGPGPHTEVVLLGKALHTGAPG